MRLLKAVRTGVLSAVLLSTLSGQSQMQVWAPIPVQANEWIAPNKPVIRLSELRSKHASEQNWTETVVSDNLFHADYISMATSSNIRLS